MQEQRRNERKFHRRRQMIQTRHCLIGLFVCVLLLIMCIIAGAGNKSEVDNTQETEAHGGAVALESEKPPAHTSPIPDDAEYIPDDTEEYEYPFNTMSHDWSGDVLEGFKYHEISRETKAAGGYFPDIVQKYTFIVCNNYGVDYEMVFALIEIESNCKYNAEGDGGNSVGYMQIQEQWHRERMERLGVDDLTNPFQNVLVGVDILAELQEQIKARGTDTLQADVLAAYNYGMNGAKKWLWDNGVHLYSYNTAILQRADELRAETAKEVKAK